MGLIRAALASRPVASLTSPHSIDQYLEHVHPMWTVTQVRARVVEVVRETGVASTVVLRPNGAWRGFKAGQHVEFGVEVEGKRRVRVFSVSSSEHRSGRTFSVSVKAHPDGYVSQHLHHALKPGDLVHLSQADGEFVLPATLPDELLLLSGGSGITPVMSMLRTLRDAKPGTQRPRVTFLHYARSREDEMFTAELDALGELADLVRVVRVYTRVPEPGAELTGRFTAEHLAAIGVDPATTLTYACGPAGLIASVREAYEAAGADEQLRVEYFKVPTVDLDAEDATGTLTFEDSGLSADNSGATILEQAEAAGLSPEYGCRMGVCNTCAVKKNHGAVRHVITGEVAANTDETVKICVQVPVGDVSMAL